MVRSTSLKVALMFSAAVVALPSAEARAQQLEEIIVTAQKREQAAADVPIALSAYSGEFLETLGLRELDEVSEFVPGLQVQLQSPNNPGLVVRGITSDSGAANQEARVSVFIDGVPASRARGAISELFDIERVEVLKGPQGTLFGRGAQIGAVSIVTRKPSVDQVEGGVRIGIGNYEAREFEAAFNAPVTDNSAIRIAAVHRERNGYIDNILGDEALNGVQVDAVRGSFLLTSGDRFDLTATVNYQEDDYTGTSFKSRLVPPPIAGGSTSPYEAAALTRGDDLGVDRELFNATLQAEYEVSDSISLTSITGYREFDAYEEFDADGTFGYLLEFGEDAHSEQWSQELRANFDAGGSFQGFVGGSFFHEKGYQRVPFSSDERLFSGLFLEQIRPTLAPGIEQIRAGLNANPAAAPLAGLLPAFPAFQNPFAPTAPANSLAFFNQLKTFLAAARGAGAAAFLPASFTGLVDNLPTTLQPLAFGEFTNFGETTAWEAFADGTWHLTPELSLTAGVRYTYEEMETTYEQGVAQPGLLAIAFPPLAGNSLSEDFHSWVGRAVASYQPTDSSLFYASVSKGRRPAVVEVTASAATTGVLDAETVWSYEAGGKISTLGDMLQLEGAVFYYDYDNFQTSVANPEGTNPPFINVDAGKASALGFEGSFVASPTEWLDLFGNYAYIDAEFDDTDSDGNPQERAGNTFRLTPKHSFALGIRGSVQIADGLNAFVTPTYNWRSRVYFDDNNTPGIEQGAYGLLNLRLGIEAPDGNWSVTAFASNLLDKEYLIDAGNTGESFGFPTYVAGAPRFYGLEASIRF